MHRGGLILKGWIAIILLTLLPWGWSRVLDLHVLVSAIYSCRDFTVHACSTLLTLAINHRWRVTVHIDYIMLLPIDVLALISGKGSPHNHVNIYFSMHFKPWHCDSVPIIIIIRVYISCAWYGLIPHHKWLHNIMLVTGTLLTLGTFCRGYGSHFVCLSVCLLPR